MPKTAISPTRAENYPQWYQEVIKAADMAEISVVRGCMVIKPWGFAIWENIQAALDARIKETGHQNIYCPLFIPLSHLQREASHVDGFATECAVVTHHRLVTDENGKLQPAGKLEEPLVVRPTSETIIGELFANWLQSYRDLPIKINQWANVVRWEMRTRMFLRTSEFLWQEGHTAHASAEEALEHTKNMLQVYVDLARTHLAMPVIAGEKTAAERFPGADNTFCIEAMMQDKKALQAGTSHFLGQNFAKAFDMSYQDQHKNIQYAWTTSWGVSTRLIGGLIMTHSDDNGLVLPPRISPEQIVIIPITHNDAEKDVVIEACHKLADKIRQRQYSDKGIRVKVDDRDLRGGEKNWSWVKKGVPIRIEIGPRELANNEASYSLRSAPYGERHTESWENIVTKAPDLLDEVHNTIFERAQVMLRQNSHTPTTLVELDKLFKEGGDGGFAFVPWAEDNAQEEDLKQKYAVTVRSIISVKYAQEVLDNNGLFSGMQCPWTQKPCEKIAVLAKSY